MEFWNNIRSSIYDPEYYRGLQEKPFSFSLSYFLLFSAALAFVVTVVLLFSAFPATQSFLSNLSNRIPEYFPTDLVITIQNGKVSTNVKEPYFLPMPPAVRENLSEKNGTSSIPTNLLVIDTKDPFTLDEFRTDDTVVLLTKDSVVAMNGNNGEIRIQSLDRVASFKLDKPTVNEFVQRFSPYLRVVYPVIAIGLYFLSFVGMIFRLIYVFFLALIVFLIAKSRELGMSYKKAYQIGVHLITLPAIVSAFFFLVAPSFNIPFLFTVIALVLAILNLKKGSASSISVPPKV